MKSFESSFSEDGIEIRLTETKRRILRKTRSNARVKDWVSSGDPEILRGLAALGSRIEIAAAEDEEFVFLSHEQGAQLSNLQAKALGLPPSIPFQLRIWSSGSWIDDSYTLNSEFLDRGQPLYLDERVGCFARVGRALYRIPQDVFSLVELVRGFPVVRDDKIACLAEIGQKIGDPSLADGAVLADEQIANIKIRHVSGFSAHVSGSLEDPQISPVVFTRRSVESAKSSGSLLDEAEQILSQGQTRSFESEFLKSEDTKPTYVLSSGEYIFIDPSVRPAFSAFRKVCSADAEGRRAFLKSPQAVLLSLMVGSTQETEELLDEVFIETSQFSERVLGVNKWVAPDIPWLASVSNDWGTDVLVFEQAGLASPVVVQKEDLELVIEAVEAALRHGKPSAFVVGAEVPATSSLLQAMKDFLPERPDKDGDQPSADSRESSGEPELDGPYIVDTLDNFESINYVTTSMPREPRFEYREPRCLVPATKLMPHQKAGLKWLIDSYNSGAPGCLIADDMGLGKTLQSLVFLAIYREECPQNLRRPCLIVAPTGLLANWIDEIERHLGDEGLGRMVNAYGAGMKDLRDGNVGKDVDSGVPMLNTSKLASAGVVLTTYESLRNYSISFAMVPFGVAVFDEVQKVKNPKVPLTRAAAAINASFQVGLSGTPVENSLADLWSIMDVVAPRRIKHSLLDFMKEFSGNTEDLDTRRKLQVLHSELTTPSELSPAPILRRLKNEVFQSGGLPKKVLHAASETSGVMPEAQAQAYSDQLRSVQKGEIKMIQALQAFRRISLSHRPYERWLDNPKSFVDESARLTEFFKILDEISQKSEKALIFLDSRELQPILAQVLKERYKLSKLPLIINGEVSGPTRQSLVKQFQSESQAFDVMIISPKAGGVGLNLVSANHVIHLQRWWNPAVEDQCNDRAYRIGQTRIVHVYTPIAVHPVSQIPSYDLVLDQILSQKRDLASSLFIPAELSPSDFKSSFFEGEPDPKQSYRPLSLEETYAMETGEEFESYVRGALSDSGFKVSTTPRSHDGKCDLIAKKGAIVVLCQVKQVRSDKTLSHGADEILDARERYLSHSPTHLALITNARQISGPQRKLAREHEVLVLSAESLAHYGEALSRLAGA